MTIQNINLGTEPLGEGGDTYRSANTKINENFSNPDHAASRLVGTEEGQVPLAEQVGSLALKSAKKDSKTNLLLNPEDSVPESSAASRLVGTEDGQVATWQSGSIAGIEKNSRTNFLLKAGDSIPSDAAASRLIGTSSGRVPLSDEVFNAYHHTGKSEPLPDFNEYWVAGTQHPKSSTQTTISINAPIANKPVNDTGTLEHIAKHLFAVQHFYGSRSTNIMVRSRAYMSGNAWTPWGYYYTTTNTTKDSNGMIKASSPVLRVFSDRIEGNGDGENMGAEFVKKGVGDYLIKGTTGLADEGWYVTVPQDANGNNLVAVEYESLENGDVTLRTYKRKFDFETTSIVADHDNPLDIPETRWVDLRFNDLPQEELDEPELDEEVEPEVGMEEPVEESE